MANLALVQGKVRESLGIDAEQRRLQLGLPGGGGAPAARLNAGLDSVWIAALVLEDAPRARALLDRALQRAPIDSIAELGRNWDPLLALAAFVGDSGRARAWHAEARRDWERAGNVSSRPAWESMTDANLALAQGRYADALSKLEEADRRNLARTDILDATRFVVLNRLQQTDSAIAVGEAYVAGTLPSRFGQDAYFLANIRQRLGELYEGKGSVEKALEHYTAFVELWKNADPELQPRVRDVRGRIERLQRRRG
jgi:tetratricopeptide (TPR) repeat protein